MDSIDQKQLLLGREAAVLYDSHAHLSDSTFDADRDEVVARAIAAGVEAIVDVGVSLASSKKAIATSHEFPSVFATVGIDPECLVPGNELFQKELLTFSEQEFQNWLAEQGDELEELMVNNADYIVGIGETGIDKHWLETALKAGQVTETEMQHSLNRQRELCRLHLELAAKHKLPVTLHSRGIETGCADLVREVSESRGVFHSYTGDYDTAKRILDSGWNLGVNGIVTFKNAGALRELYKKILGDVSSDWGPADFYCRGIVFETDAPYLAPLGHRGERNESAYIVKIKDACKILVT